MLLDVENISSRKCLDAIHQAIRAQDPAASVSIKIDTGQVRVEGGLSQQQAIDALAAAGYTASNAAPHSGEGSDCCGGCS